MLFRSTAASAGDRNTHLPIKHMQADRVHAGGSVPSGKLTGVGPGRSRSLQGAWVAVWWGGLGLRSGGSQRPCLPAVVARCLGRLGCLYLYDHTRQGSAHPFWPRWARAHTGPWERAPGICSLRVGRGWEGAAGGSQGVSLGGLCRGGGGEDATTAMGVGRREQVRPGGNPGIVRDPEMRAFEEVLSCVSGGCWGSEGL